MAPDATSSAAPTIPSQDRRGSDDPSWLPILVTTCSRDRRFNGLDNGTDAALLAGIGLLQSGDVELGHIHHGPRDPGRLGGVGVGDHVEEYGRDDLPAQPVPVLEPPAGDLLAVIGQAVPVVVH